MNTKIYFNPACSKCRSSLALLNEHGIEAEVIEYLTTPPDKTTLKEILSKLGLNARQLMRTHEAEYKDQNLDDTTLSEDALIDAMIATPKLIERPIVVTDKGVAIGRPPENIIKVL
jgi:arsenate reductase